MEMFGRIVTGLGVICFAWFIVFFIKYGWDINLGNCTMGLIGAIFITGGLKS
jgi:hypothetical protein